MALKIEPNAKNIIKRDIKNISIPCPYSGEKISKGEMSPEHITPVPKNINKYPYSKEELATRLEKIEKQIKQNPDDIDLRKYYDALKNLL